jgi:spore germination protein YaaH
MKKLIMMILAGGVLYSCGQPNEPKVVTQKFEEAIHQGKLEEAKKYAAEPTQKKIDMIVMFGKINVNPNFTFNFVRDSISENTAWVWYKNEKGFEAREKLAKIDGKWLVVDVQKVKTKLY